MRASTALALFVFFAARSAAQGTGATEARKLLAAGDYSQAEVSLRALLRDPASDPERAMVVKLSLADLLREEGRSAEARELFEDALAAPGLGPKERMNALSGLADIECHEGRMDRSLAKWNETLAIAREQKDSRNEANALRGMAVCWLNAGDPSRAEPLLRRALSMLENDPNARAWDRASALTALAQCYRAEGKFMLAENSFNQSLEIDRRTLGEKHPQVAFVMEQLAIVYASTRRFDLARTSALNAEKIMREACGEDSLAVASSLAIEAEVEIRANNAAAATGKYALALDIVRKHPASRSFAVRIMQSYAGALRTIHRSREAGALNAEIKTLLRNPA